MAGPFVVACSHCAAKLKLKDESFAGRKLRCPKCQEAFVVPAAGKPAAGAAAKKKPAKPKDDFDFGGLEEDDYEPPAGEDGAGDDFDDLPKSPVARKKSGGKSGGKKKKKSSSDAGFGRMALIGALVLLGVGVVGGVGYGIYALVSGMGGGAGRLAWLPDDTDMVIEVRVKEAWNSGVVAPLRNGEIGKTITERMKGEAQLDPNDIDRVVVGVSMDSQTPVVVVYANKPIDQTDVKQGATASSYGGYELYSKGGAESMFFPDASTLVGGPEAKLKAAIDRQGVCPVADQFGHLPTSGTLVFGANKIAKPNGEVPAMFTAGSFDPTKLKSLSAAISLGTDIELEFSCDCPDAATAEQMVQSVEKDKVNSMAQLKEQRTQMESNPLLKLSPMSGLLSGAEQALESYHVSSSGTTVSGGLKVPGKLVKDAAESMGPMMSMMMQQLPSPGGSGGEFAPGPGEFPPTSSQNPPMSATPPASPHGESPVPTANAQSVPGRAHGEAPAPAGAHGEAPPSGAAHGQAPPAGAGQEAAPPAGRAHGEAPPAGAGQEAAPPAGKAHGEAPPAGAGQGAAPPAGAAHGESPPAPRG